MEEALQEALQLVIGGVPIALGVFLTVQGLKVYGIVSETSQVGKAAIASGLFFGVLSAVAQAFPVAAPYIEIAFVTYVGSMIAGLFYEYIAAPILERFGAKMSTESLNGK
jgi:hypothetical protein